MEGDSLLVHFLCPYAQRALYALAYKGITSIRIEEVDLSNKPARLLEANPHGKVPTLRLESGGQKRFLYESLIVSEYFDSYPGPPLYPRTAEGVADPYSKAALDIIVKEVDSTIPAVYFAQFAHPSAENLDKLLKATANIDKLVPEGHYFAFAVLGLDEITIADIMIYPLIERLLALKNADGQDEFDIVQFSNLGLWFGRMSRLEWVQRYKASPSRLDKLRRVFSSGSFTGLQLPLTKYDS